MKTDLRRDRLGVIATPKKITTAIPFETGNAEPAA
jgi:hypothetical protein